MLGAPFSRLWRAAASAPRLYVLLAGLGGLLVGGVLGTAAWLVSPEGEAARSVQEVTITIPPGTAGRLAAGESITLVPPTVSLTSGDRIVVINHDAVSHAIGRYLIGPGETATIPFEGSGANRLLCTFHPGGTLQFEVGDRPSLGRSLLVAGAMIGLPLGAVSSGITYLVSRLLA